MCTQWSTVISPDPVFNDLIKSYCPASKFCFIFPWNCRPKNHKAERPDWLLPAPTRQSDWTPTNGRNSKSCHLRVGRSPVGHHQFLLRERESQHVFPSHRCFYMSTESSQISPLYRIDYQNYITLHCRAHGRQTAPGKFPFQHTIGKSMLNRHVNIQPHIETVPGNKRVVHFTSAKVYYTECRLHSTVIHLFL